MSTKNFVSYGDAETLFTGIGNKLSTLKSGLTDLSDHVDGDATTYPYADVITIPDAVPANLADCSVKIEPVQDLHGYDHPWVGGAGKNKLPLVLADIKTLNTDGTWSGNAYTLYGVTFTVQTDNDGNITGINVNGVPERNTYIILERGNLQKYSGMVLNGCPAGGSNSTYLVRIQKTSGDYATYATDTGNGVTISDAITSDGAMVYISINSGYSVQNVKFYPMVRLATETDATFAPYTNICPITGHTEASVQRDGRNLFDKSAVTSGYRLDISTGLLDVILGFCVTDYIKCNESTTYTANWQYYSAGNYGMAFYDANKMYISGARQASEAGHSSDPWTFTTPNGAKYFRMTYVEKNVDVNTLQVELGSTATPYEPYAGKTYTIALGDTIYSGTVRIDSNGNTVMDVDRAIVEYDGSEDESWLLDDSGANYFFYIELTGRDITKSVDANNCASAPIGKTTIDLGVGTDARHLRYRYANDNSLTVSDLKTFLASNNLQVCYYLATPTTIQLTPTQIQLLKGTNTLTASTGQISVTVNGVSGAIGQVQEQVNELDDNKVGFVKIAQPIKTLTDATESYTVPCDCYMNAFLKSSTGYTAYIKVGNTEIISVSNSTDPDGRYITLPIKKGSVITMREGQDYSYRILFYEIA